MNAPVSLPDMPDERPQRRREWSGPVRSVVVPLVIVGAIIGVLWYVQSRDGSGDDGSTEIPGAAPTAGNPAPDFQLTSMDGEPVMLSELRGRPVIVNFWATWCEPCRTEMPDLSLAASQHGDQGLVVLAVNLQEDRGSIAGFAEEFGIDFPILLDPDGTVMRRYRVNGVPQSFFIDREGIVQFVRLGPLTEEDLDDRLNEILEPGGG